MDNKRFTQAVIVAALALPLIALAAWASITLSTPSAPNQARGVGVTLPAGISLGGSFQLTDQHGNTVSPEDFDGKHLLIYFGYTFCPDVCPTDVNDMALAHDALGDKAEAVKPVFITVDPKRDTSPRLAEFVSAFSENMAGLTGSDEDIKAIARQFRVYYNRRDEEDPEFYLVDHSAYTYFTNPSGDVMIMFSHQTEPEAMAAEIRKEL